MVFFPVRTVLARNRPLRLFSYLGEASRERSLTAKPKFAALPSRQSKSSGNWADDCPIEKDIVSDSQSSAQFCELPIVALAEAIKSDP